MSTTSVFEFGPPEKYPCWCFRWGIVSGGWAAKWVYVKEEPKVSLSDDGETRGVLYWSDNSENEMPTVPLPEHWTMFSRKKTLEEARQAKLDRMQFSITLLRRDVESAMEQIKKAADEELE